MQAHSWAINVCNFGFFSTTFTKIFSSKWISILKLDYVQSEDSGEKCTVTIP